MSSDRMTAVSWVLAFLASSPWLAAQCTSTWLPGGGWDAPIVAFVTMPNGDLIAGGAFTTAEGVPCLHLARKSGTTWSPVGGGITSTVTGLARTTSGDLIVAADNGVSVWNGVSWQYLGVPAGPTPSTTTCVAADANDEIFATFRSYTAIPGLGGVWSYTTARWTGTAWSPVLGPTSYYGINVVHTSQSGTLYAGLKSLTSSVPTHVSGYVAQWTGSSWQQMGSLAWGEVTALTTLHSGEVVKVQGYTVSRWNGTDWSPFGPFAHGATVLPDGDLVVVGGTVARWNGTTWTTLASGITSGPNSAYASSVAFDPEGAIMVSGAFTAIGALATNKTARYMTTCPTAVGTHTLGCPTSVGNAQWTVTSGPWVGTTYRATCANLPALSFVIDVIGVLSNPTPLATLLPGAGIPGCTLVPATHFLEVRTVGNGRAESTFAIPDLVGLAGFPFFHQMIPFEFDGSLNLIGVTGTDTLQLTIGEF